MTMSVSLEKIERLRVVPALVVEDVNSAVPLAAALVKGGLPCAEVTLRTEASMEVLRRMAKVEGLLVGAGTVTSVKQLDEVLEAGADFIVSPGLDDELIRRCQDADVLIIPGAVTPTEVMRAQNLGIGLVKFFPSHAFGGLPTLEALAGPFPNMRFMPTGGINPTNMSRFLAHPSVAACGGTWMARREWIKSGAWDHVEAACRETQTLLMKPSEGGGAAGGFRKGG